MNNQVIVPLCIFSKPCFTICSTPSCRQKPFICGYQGCRCQLAHQKCQKPLNWKQLFDAIKVRGSGAPELKAYFDAVLGTLHKNIVELSKEKDKLAFQVMSIGFQPAQRDLANAVVSNKFDTISSALVHQAVEELKYPSIPLTKTKSQIDSEIMSLNKYFEQIMNEVKAIGNIEIPKIEMVNDSTLTSNTSTMSVPKINTIPPGLESTNSKPLQHQIPQQQIPQQQIPQQPQTIPQPQQYQPHPLHQQRQFQPQPPPQHLLPNSQPQKPPQMNQPNVIPSIPPTSISISDALKDMSINKQPQQQPFIKTVQSAPIPESGPPMAPNTNHLAQTKSIEADFKKFLAANCVQMQIQKKKHIPTDQNYEFENVNYLKLKGCSFVQARILEKHFKNLTRLSLYNCNIGKEGAIAIGSLSKLTFLDVTGNTIGDVGLKAICEGIPNLEVLGVTGNEITDAGAAHIANNLSNLVELRLAYNKITEKAAILIAEKCQKINSLDINNSKFSQEAKEAIRKLLPKRHLSL